MALAHKLVEDFTEEAPDVTLAIVMTTLVMLMSGGSRVLRPSTKETFEVWRPTLVCKSS